MRLLASYGNPRSITQSCVLQLLSGNFARFHSFRHHFVSKAITWYSFRWEATGPPSQVPLYFVTRRTIDMNIPHTQRVAVFIYRVIHVRRIHSHLRNIFHSKQTPIAYHQINSTFSSICTEIFLLPSQFSKRKKHIVCSILLCSTLKF